jgi:hypothetical protein
LIGAVDEGPLGEHEIGGRAPHRVIDGHHVHDSGRGEGPSDQANEADAVFLMMPQGVEVFQLPIPLAELILGVGSAGQMQRGLIVQEQHDLVGLLGQRLQFNLLDLGGDINDAPDFCIKFMAKPGELAILQPEPGGARGCAAAFFGPGKLRLAMTKVGIANVLQ